ncbi:class I SAM-dependent RNA methyltransferase [Candidatus Gracilibacteria bacterium]|nr:class I SAM-dependent RNA methyltransferase [Candidatus Gracilibacteria bacterium]
MQSTTNPSIYRLVLTCQSGLESLVKRECERLRCSEIQAQDRLISCTGTEENMYELLVWSRFSNRVYIELGSQKTEDFDTLYDSLASINWGEYLTGKEHIVIEASSTRSTLESVPTLQSVGQRAIFSTLNTPNITNGTEVHILILIIDNIAHILLDITGDPLHKRGYRREAGEAPIKENLASALVAFANWKYSTPLLDPMCGSGTIAIEAVMIARNIAPGLNRHFRVEELPFFNRELLSVVKEKAKGKIYPSGKYRVQASDIDSAMIKIAQSNAKRAGVDMDIAFSTSNFVDSPLSDGIIISNPPYGNRLQNPEIDTIYNKLVGHISEFGGGFITSHPLEGRHQLANKKLLNGGEECRFWYKKV